jgi:phosphoenolpyruvate carboxykinase (GTP)
MSSSNLHVNQWVESVAGITKPKNIVWINGSDGEFQKICQGLHADGTFIKLNEEKYPGCYLSRSHPFDVARVENRTFICSQSEENCGPTNNWSDPKAMYKKLNSLLDSCMKGRTMFVVPYLMGPDGSPYSKVGFELTDSAYVVANMRIMARIGDVALKNLPNTPDGFVKGVHSVGTLDPEERYICHFPEDNTIISINSNYGGNALQGKKCFALRIASTLARKQGWLAEHMLIVGITNPKGSTKYFCAAFPSGCGKTNLAMLIPPPAYREQGWKVSTVGDDIAWLNVGPDGQLYAINPEAGFFGIAPGTSDKTNPIAMQTIKKNTIFTNTALNPYDGTPWWEGLGEAPDSLIDWTGAPWHPGSSTKAAHPNARFTAPASQCPSIDAKWQAAEGVPISGIIFGGRRARVAPLVVEAFDWNHGVFMGATMASERTAAAEGKVGQLRHDPMAMAPFIGYHVCDYLSHWLSFNEKKDLKLPKVFHVNWFRTDKDSKFLWPGFGENMRVLEWMFNRCEGTAEALKTPIGNMPSAKTIRRDGLDVSESIMQQLLSTNKDELLEECTAQEEYFSSLGAKFPAKLMKELAAQKERVASS